MLSSFFSWALPQGSRTNPQFRRKLPQISAHKQPGVQLCVFMTTVCFAVLPRALRSPPRLCGQGNHPWHLPCGPLVKGGTRPHKLRCQQPHGAEGREKPQAQDPVHLVAWPAAVGSQRQQAQQPCVLKYGLGDRTCSTGVQARCPGEAATSRGSAVAPSWGCRLQARGRAGDAHTNTHTLPVLSIEAASRVGNGWLPLLL